MSIYKRVAGNLIIQTVSAADSVTFQGATANTATVVINGNLSVTGNASLTGNIAGDNIFNGTTSIAIPVASGNATVSVGGVSNVTVFASTGQQVTGVVLATGNVTGGNVITGGLVTASGNVNSTGGVLATGNVTGGNVITGGLITATGNTRAGNLNTPGLVSATGNVIGGNLVGTLANGTSNISIPAASGNIQVAVAGAEQLRIIANATSNRPVEITGGVGGSIGGRVGVTNESLDLYTSNGYPVYISTSGARGNVQFQVSHTASTVNYVTVTGGATGTGATVSATGTDANVNLRLAAKASGQVQELVGSTYYALASQYDVGTNPNQIPLNQYLGTMAYQDSAGISVGTAAMGIGTGLEGLRVTPVASSVNYINTTGSIAGSSPEFITAGSDTNIGLNVSTKGTGTLLFRTNTSNTQFAVAHTATANNYIQISGGSGVAPSITAVGADTNVGANYISKGTGTHFFATNNSASTVQFAVAHTATANNYIQVSGASGASPGLSAIGADTNVGLNINTKGTGTLLFRTNTSNTQFAVAHTATANNYIQITGGSGASPNVSAQGADTNVGILVAAKGTGNIAFTVGNVIVTGAGGLGYGTGSGGTQTQTTSRTQGVTLNKTNGSITLVSAAGTTAWQSFTVTNSTVAATDTVIVNQKSGTDLYQIFVTAVAAGSFNITFATTGGTTTEQPVFNFAVIKAVTA